MQSNEVGLKLIPTYQDYVRKFQKQTGLRKLNFQKQQQDMQFFGNNNKTAAIKTIQKFISKFKMQKKDHQNILQQMDTLNLSKYTDQIANIIVNSLTQKDIQFYTEVSTKLNKQYSNFPTIIIEYLKKLFTTLYQSPQDNKSRLKAVLIFTTQLFVCGFAFSYKQIRQMLIKIFKSGNKKKNNIDNQTEKKLFAFYYNSQCFVQFLINYWQQFTKLIPTWIINWKQHNLIIKEFPPSVPPAQKQQLTKFFTKYISECQNVLIQNIELLKQYQQQLKQNLRMQGQFNKQNQKKYTNLSNIFKITKQNLQIICRAANQPFNTQKLDFKISELSDIMKLYVNTDGDADIFQDQFQKEIYQNLPQFTKQQGKLNEQDYKEFRQKIQKCKNVADADMLAKEFQKYNNKKNRKLLVKDILQYRKQYYLVTPYFCRIAAIVNQSWRDVGEMINQQLFFDYDKLKDNSSSAFLITDKKNRNWKYLCEFTKFKIVDPEKIIVCLHNLIQDLKGNNIELLIFALENVGRFLFLTSKTANKFTFLLNKLENVVKQKSFPMLTTSRLINIMTLIKPVIEQQTKQQKVLTEQEKQAMQILNSDITGDLQQILRKIRKFISKGKQNLQSFNRILIEKILQYNFIGNYNYAFMLLQLNNQQVIQFIVKNATNILFNSVKTYEYQKSMILSRFLGQMFKYELLKKSELYGMLQDLLKIEGNQIGVINCVCTILQTCVGYLDSKKILSQNNKFRFLYSFKKYLQKCKYIPMMQQFKITDIFQSYQQKYLCNLAIEYADQFMLVFNGKKDRQGKQLNLSKQFDKYIDKKGLKEKVPQTQEKLDSLEDRKRQNQKFIDEDQEMDKKNNLELLKTQAKNFESEFNMTLNSNIKDFSSRMTKQAFVQKNIEKNKQKKKEGNEKVITVIGRSGTKFIKRDVAVKSQLQEDQVKKDEPKL